MFTPIHASKTPKSDYSNKQSFTRASFQGGNDMKFSIKAQRQSSMKIIRPKPTNNNQENILESKEYKKLESKYLELVSAIKQMFLNVNKKYFEYGPDDVSEKFRRKQDEFGYDKIEPIRIIELTTELIDLFCVYKTETEDLVNNYKLLKDCDDESRDYIWLLQKSERDMRQAIRENQQLKQQGENLQLKIKNNEKQIDLLSQYTEKAMEEMKKEFIFAIDLLADRESSLQILKDEIKRKDEVIRSLDEQLISVLVLEHKINYLGQRFEKEKEKSQVDFEDKMKRNERQIKDILSKDNQNKEKKINQLEQILKQQQIQKNNVERELKTQIDKISKTVDLQNEELAIRIKKMNKFQSQLVDYRHLELVINKQKQLLITINILSHISTLRSLEQNQM